VIEQCEAWERDAFALQVNRNRAAWLCAITRAEWLNHSMPLWGLFSASQIEKNLKMAQEVPLPASERLYLEGRLYGALPPGFGRDF
jgi:hypothetical protein